MSAGIIRALMQLFAIIAGANRSSGREIVAVFLRQQLNKELVNQYLELYEDFADKFHRSRSTAEKRNSMASVKVLRICNQINEELQQKEKIFVVVRLLEFICEFSQRENLDWELVQTVAEAFNIEPATFRRLRILVEQGADVIPADDQFLRASGEKEQPKGQKWFHIHELKGQFRFLWLKDEGLCFVRYFGPDELFLNSQNIIPGRTYVFGQGSTIRGSRISPVFYSDVLREFIVTPEGNNIVYRAENVSYYFPTGKQALHQFNLVEESGTLVGIMGGSGSGKSTLLNVLNGNDTPTYGKVTINGFDIHLESKSTKGLLGYVAQDDLLIEELSVYQNLYYNARLCFNDKSEEEINELVMAALSSIGLLEAKDLRVGSVLDKTISGGQRKRLNIALELIREPAVLFVDEPTSGLSSRDSENIMDLLKELTLRGKLIFVVIHQPSSDIFKMLDKLFILDQGGYPIYYGNPVESIIYFKRLVNQVNLTESECPRCGNVNPEQIFNIIEARVVDEYGNETIHRKISPKEWNNFFNVIIGNHLSRRESVREEVRTGFTLPGFFSQMKVYFIRDVLSKLANRQYMLINLLEAPVLALILSLFIKYYPADGELDHEYTFRENLNFPQYLFISVVVALFLGLTVSAEEIIKDQKILKRERYLRLSRKSYLFSKIGLMFLISLFQSLCFVAIGNAILEVRGMLVPFWMVLFSTSCFANILGLNISASFNSAKVIYIIIPILIIPQLLFSGVIVRFDRLLPAISSQSRVPWIGNIMASRWAYEAMAVHQFRYNAYQAHFFDFESRRKYYNWKKDYWIKELRGRVQESRKLLETGSDPVKLDYHRSVLAREFRKEMSRVPGLEVIGIQALEDGQIRAELLDELTAMLTVLEQYYVSNHNKVNQERESKIAVLTATTQLRDNYLKLLDDYHNESLEDFVTSKNDLRKIVEYKGELIQKYNQIYLIPDPANGFLGSQFYAPSKPIFGKQVTTLSANIMVLWLMSASMAIILFADGLRKFLTWTAQPYLPRLKRRKKI